jgi:hypothetical protein
MVDVGLGQLALAALVDVLARCEVERAGKQQDWVFRHAHLWSGGREQGRAAIPACHPWRSLHERRSPRANMMASVYPRKGVP